MGIYLNPGNSSFQEIVNSKIYVDKSLLIQYTNEILKTSDKYLCISRPRRFGKSTDARMLAAYYDISCDSKELFDNLKIANSECYLESINKYNVILLNIQSFLSKAKNVDEMISLLTRLVVRDLKQEYPNTDFFDENNLVFVLEDIYVQNNNASFILIIDEWDCIFREYQNDKQAQNNYLDFLRDLLKDKPYVSLCYMTGILPIKKYGTHSALNMFKEVSMIEPFEYSKFMGFTNKEVSQLCNQYNMNLDDLQAWYDGYHLQEDISIYSPRSVVLAIQAKRCNNYWTSTETYEALKIYIDMNLDGLKDDIVKLLAGEKVNVDVGSFQNDMTTFASKDDVLTLLVHLGYLGYLNKQVYIPNHEVTDSFIQSIKNSNWKKVTEALKNSQELLEATLRMDSEAVARYIELAHLETSILSYNDENALSYTISLAYYMAKAHYRIIRELPSGKGFADLVFIPTGDKPAMIIELKYDQDVSTAIKQIKDKAYYFGLENYLDNLLLVGISYDKKTKEHSCVIEKYQ